MKSVFLTAFILALFVINAEARDTRSMYSYKAAMETKDAEAKLGKDIQFFFGNQKPPGVEKDMGEYTANKKTNAFNKSDEVACQRAALSAMLSLRDRARSVGANAVTNIKSYYKKNLVESPTEYECGAGGLMAGVTLKGTMVKTK